MYCHGSNSTPTFKCHCRSPSDCNWVFKFNTKKKLIYTIEYFYLIAIQFTTSMAGNMQLCCSSILLLVQNGQKNWMVIIKAFHIHQTYLIMIHWFPLLLRHTPAIQQVENKSSVSLKEVEDVIVSIYSREYPIDYIVLKTKQKLNGRPCKLLF